MNGACEHCWDHHEGPCVASVRSERDALAARLAEVEAEAYYWRSLCSEDDRVEQLQRRLAEVEAERDRAQSLARLNSLMGGEGPVMVPVEAARCPDCGSERYRHHRSDVVAERDRLAQEHDELLAEFHEYAEHQSWRCGHAPHYYLVGGEALESCPCGLDEVLARFPREGDGDDS